MIELDIDHHEIERRKDYYHRVFHYCRVDHMPIFIWVRGFDNSGPNTLRASLESTERQFQTNLKNIQRTLQLVPDDYIPTARITQGYMTIATMFNLPVHWSNDPNQPPGIQEHLIMDLEEIYSLQRPTMDDGFMPENIRRMHYHAMNLSPDVYLTGLDIGGPLNNMRDLVDTNLFYTSFYDNPKAVQCLLDLLTSIQVEIYQEIIRVVGDIHRFGCLDFDPLWHPEDVVGFSTDDVSATISPKTFKEFGIPYHNRIYEAWGNGGFHNCGPHPGKHFYRAIQPPVKYLNCSYNHSFKEFAEFRSEFAGWGVIEAMFDCNETAEEMLAGYRFAVETLSPDVIIIPMCMVDNTWRDDDVTDLYMEMRKISDEYAKYFRWLNN
jgi:hypothetical protein